MIPFRNNLCKDDTVMHADTRRVGKVAKGPRESSSMVSILWQGTVTAQYVDILKLRLVVNGKPEDVPPCDGTPGVRPEAIARPAATPEFSAVASLEKQRDEITGRMAEHEKQFKDLRASKDRIERAITALKAPAE